MTRGRWGVIALVVLIVSAFFAFDVQQYLSIEKMQEQREILLSLREAKPWLFAVGFFVAYIVFTGLSLPGASILTLVAGALFGLAAGTLIVSFASSVGATLAFLLARYLARDAVQSRFASQLRAVNAGIESDGAYYLLSLRLVPLFPYFLINLVMGLTPIRTGVFYLVSQIGMLPATIVFVNAGTQLGSIESAGDILSRNLIVSLTLLGLFPWVARVLSEQIITRFRENRILSRYPKPDSFDYNLLVIGAGSGGLVSAYIAAAVKARVALVEREKMGGDCLNTGCVPSKALIRSARVMADARRAGELGFKKIDVEFDFAEIMARVQRVIEKIEPHDSVERYTELGVECIRGDATVLSPWEVEVNGQRISARSLIIATGGRPAVPPIPGLESVPWYTSDTIWGLRSLPARMLVLGGGPIGCELAQCFARFGSQVSMIEMREQILPREDPEAAKIVLDALHADGVTTFPGHKAVAFSDGDTGPRLSCINESDKTEIDIEFDAVLLALGRRANWRGFGLEELGIGGDERGNLAVNQHLQTAIPTIFACGDVAGPYQFTHAAAHQAWYAAVNALFGHWRRFKVDYSVMPAVTFTEPELARVGLNETEARAAGVDFEITEYDLGDLDRAIAESAGPGLVRVLSVPGRDRILGACVVGAQAGEILAEFVTAMKAGHGLNKILGTIHAYPTFSEASKFAAGNWKRAHAPRWLLKRLGVYHRWRL